MFESVGRLGSVALDCDDPRALATFWARILGGEVDGPLLVTVRVPDYQPRFKPACACGNLAPRNASAPQSGDIPT